METAEPNQKARWLNAKPSLSTSASSSSLKEPLSPAYQTHDEETAAKHDGEITKNHNVSKDGILKKNKGILLLIFASVVLLMSVFLSVSSTARHAVFGKPIKHVAFIGNSMIYFYDLPRSLEAVSDGRVHQNSVLAAAGSLTNMREKHNGMWNRWRTDKNVLYTLDEALNDDAQGFADDTVWDFGSCTVEMLLFGHDAEQAQVTHDEWWAYREQYGLQDDDAWQGGSGSNNDDDDAWVDGSSAYNSDDDDSVEMDNGDYRFTNPCAQSQAYLNFLNQLPDSDIRKTPPKQWDYLVIDDQTKRPKYEGTREEGISALKITYLPLFEKIKATPAFLVTPAYWINRDQDDDSNVNSYENVPYWTVQTYEGYKQYAEYLAGTLPYWQKPKLINVGIAFLVVYEEDTSLWMDLFWVDNKHQSPHGSFLQSCLLHHVVYGHLPSKSTVIRTNMTTLWDDTRTMMYPRDTVVPFPTTEEAEYLYDVCHRVANGYIPQLMIEELAASNLSLYK